MENLKLLAMWLLFIVVVVEIVMFVWSRFAHSVRRRVAEWEMCRALDRGDFDAALAVLVVYHVFDRAQHDAIKMRLDQIVLEQCKREAKEKEGSDAGKEG